MSFPEVEAAEGVVLPDEGFVLSVDDGVIVRGACLTGDTLVPVDGLAVDEDTLPVCLDGDAVLAERLTAGVWLDALLPVWREGLA